MNEPMIIPYQDGIQSLYPYRDLEWQKHIDRFGVVLPEPIVDLSMGTSKCRGCGQVYAGYQRYCERLRWGYRTKNGYGISFASDKFVGEYTSSYYCTQVIEVGEYPCQSWCEWSLQIEFDRQITIFDTIQSLVDAFHTHTKHPNISLSQDYIEKLALYEKIQSLEHQNQQLICAVKEIVDRMNQSGACLMGINL